MFVPVWLLVRLSLSFAGLVAWSYLLANGRNPLPFPDRGSRIFSAPSPEAKDAIVDLLGRHQSVRLRRGQQVGLRCEGACHGSC